MILDCEFLIITTRLTSLLIKIGTIKVNTFLPMRNKFVYFCNVKVCASGFDKLGKHFLPPIGCGSIFPAKSFWMLEEVVVSWQEVR